MNFASLHRTLSVFVILLSAGFTSPVFAQEQEAKETAALAKAHTEFVELLKNTDNVFYKEGDDEGRKFYLVMFELNGASTKMVISLKVLGTYSDKVIVGMSAWALVSETEEAVPPAVIKAVATMNDRLTLGSLSCSEDFKRVYANLNAATEGLTPGALWMYFAYVQSNAKEAKSIVEEAMPAAGR